MSSYVKSLRDTGMSDVASVGGKNASLGEMLHHLGDLGVRVPGGFATTTDAYHLFMREAGLEDRIHDALAKLDVRDVHELTRVGREIRAAVENADLPSAVQDAIAEAYQELDPDVSFAVRSSATAEDTADASFAGQQETYLNVSGLANVQHAVKKVYASLFNDRAIAYRVHHGFEHRDVGISAGVQQMVRSDLAASGVAFTLDTESGFPGVVFVTGSFGLGEAVVQGAVNPDEFYLYKPNLEAGRPAVLSRTLGEKAVKMIYGDNGEVEHSIKTVTTPDDDRWRFVLTDDELEELGRQALVIEKHYGRPMDIEWAKDGLDGHIYIVQARPETVKSQQEGQVLEQYRLESRGEVLAEGRAVGQKIAVGTTRLIEDTDDMNELGEGEVLVTDMTDPDWEPVMKRAAAIVTNRGGRTCHAAIIARELGIPAVVGCGSATEDIPDGAAVTVSCAEGDEGYVYKGKLRYEETQVELSNLPELPVKLTMNVGNPSALPDWNSSSIA
jgi:pyruvate,water dikinase